MAKEFQGTDGQIARWLERFLAYDIFVQHRPGRKHLNADALSWKSTIDNCFALAEEEDSFGIRLVQEKDLFLKLINEWVVTDARPNND